MGFRHNSSNCDRHIQAHVGRDTRFLPGWWLVPAFLLGSLFMTWIAISLV
jgi:hypothetical protein